MAIRKFHIRNLIDKISIKIEIITNFFDTKFINKFKKFY